MNLTHLHLKLQAKYLSFKKYHPRRFKWIKITSVVLALFIVLQSGIGIWYALTQRNKPTTFGASFSIKQARAFGLDPQETLRAMFKDLGLKRVRLMSYWDIHEPTQGAYDFTELDWQFREAEKATVKVSLAIGIRQPRWPECHQAEWTRDLSSSELRGAINTYLEKVVNRYKASPALESYQLENEFFIAAFGECENFDRERLIDEYDLVKRTDPDHPIIVSLSHNFVGLPTRGPQPDIYGLSIYRRLYSTNYYRGYVTYPVPAWYYTIRAGWIKLWTGQDSIVHEFQMEPWGTKPTENMTIAEQDESITVNDIRGRFGFAKATRIKTVDLWGAEWWYWRKVHFNDPGPWEAVKREL